MRTSIFVGPFLGSIMCGVGLVTRAANADQSSQSMWVSCSVELRLTFLDSGTISKETVLSRAAVILREIEAISGCHRQVAKELYNSCTSLGDYKTRVTVSDNEIQFPGFRPVSVERLQDIYALRLSLCEIRSAEVKVPKPCEPIANDNPCKRAGISFLWSSDCYYGETESVRLEHEKRCRRALIESSTHWTSYSNNRQNVVTLCYSARASIEHGLYPE